ncbi:uncharacterized protein LOC129770786 [Toxorhynchites rutilus septentrionalis]|uniref:uncharacterized protein LOC129770786 n=1 Tax=Toxorhynchites rutilus septentrionalis TaxID=329112 RepID=UPI002478A366|nr:uncharacterized protein LOC129770786 [Toxorhynchites rutilus septentrionalis]
MEESRTNSSKLVVLDKSTEVVLYPDLFPEEPPSIEAEIKRGIKELKQRKRKAKRKNRKPIDATKSRIAKIVFPGPPRFRGCHHNESIIIDRDILSTNEHIRLLAMPRVKPKPEHPRVVIKTIPAATNHIKTLAQPKAYAVRDTINLHGARLKSHQMERITQRLNARDYLTIPEAQQFARQQRRDEKKWLRYRQKQARVLKKRIVRLELDYLRGVMEKVYRLTRNYFLNNEKPNLENELAFASEVILTRICQVIRVKAPERSSKMELDQYYWELADKMALWMWKIMQASDVTFERPEEVDKRLSAASSVFEDPTKRSKKSENEEEVTEEVEELVADDETFNIVEGVIRGCIASAMLAVYELENQTLSGHEPSYSGGHSVSQTAMAADHNSVSRIESEQASKVNFLLRKSSTNGELMDVKLDYIDDANQEAEPPNE